MFGLILITISSCQLRNSQLNSGKTIIGSIQSDDINSVIFYSDTLFKVVPVLNRQFEVSIPNVSNNQYWGIAAKFHKAYFYIPDTDTIRMNIDSKAFNASLCSNFNDPINDYLCVKQNKIKDLNIMSIDSSQIISKLDSLSRIIDQDFELFVVNNKQIPEQVKKTEEVNISAELQILDLINKNVTGRKAILRNNIGFDDNFMKSPKYLDLLDMQRWSLPNQRIISDGKNQQSMDLDELISYQMEEIGKIEENNIRSFLMLKALRTQIAMKGIESIQSNLAIFEKNNSIKRYSNLINEMIADREAIAKGMNATDFEYENNIGEWVKLSDFKGKYVLIDLWATWCKPCIEEMPYLKEIENTLNDENIEFIAISIDKDKVKWQQYLSKNKMNGIQLIADKAEESSVMKDYKLLNLPNYILIDDRGKIITVSAPKPSSGELLKLLEDELK